MLHETITQKIATEFRHPLTSEQTKVADKLARFVLTSQERSAFILRGYAGTGKTSLIGALVQTLRKMKRRVILLAPTGRAAKVFAAHAHMPAYTIHKHIYRQQAFQGESTRFTLNYNRFPNTLFIVDEASMLANQGGGASLFGSGLLLDDLVEYAYSAPGCRLLFVGDTAQLPPVGEEESPALRTDVLQIYGLDVSEADLTEVVRQSRDSDILAGATHLRQLISEGSICLPTIHGDEHGEVCFMPGNELVEALSDAYHEFGTQDTIVITRSNKRANIYNEGIRARIFDREGMLTRGDLVMAVKNNYHWTEQYTKEVGEEGPPVPFDFIANGDTAEVSRIENFQEAYGFHFADAVLTFPDYGNFELHCRVLLDTLSSESPSLTREESNRLYESILQDYEHIHSRRKRMKALRQDPFYNALQIKYAYAVTCHKAQGGQWSRVFVDQGYITQEMGGVPYLRWLYTAFTRTTGRLFLVNWPPSQRSDKL